MYETDNDEKLSRFSIAVNEKIDEQINSILTDAQNQKENILNSAEEQILQEMFDKMQSQIKQMKAKYKMLKSQALQDNKKETLIYRQKLADRVFENVESKLKAFTDSPDYEAYLLKLLNDEPVSDNTVIRLSERDFKFKDKLSEAVNSNCNFEIDKSIKFGGLSVFDKKSLVVNDKTIDNALEEQKKQFGCNYSFNESFDECQNLNHTAN